MIPSKKRKKEAEKTWWECICGAKVKILLDWPNNKGCKCGDVYMECWFSMPEHKAELEAERSEVMRMN